MSDLKFTQTDIPAVPARPREPNPFDNAFPSDDKALSVEVPYAHDSKEIAKLRSQAQAAARAVDRSARFVVEPKGKGSVITTWTRERITRPRKGAK